MKEKKTYIVVGDNNYWYATSPLMTEKQAITMLNRIRREIKQGYFGKASEVFHLFLFEAREVALIEVYPDYEKRRKPRVRTKHPII